MKQPPLHPDVVSQICFLRHNDKTVQRNCHWYSPLNGVCSFNLAIGNFKKYQTGTFPHSGNQLCLSLFYMSFNIQTNENRVSFQGC